MRLSRSGVSSEQRTQERCRHSEVALIQAHQHNDNPHPHR